MARKPQSSKDSRSPRDRLSADFLQSFAEDFALNGVEVIKALREKSPERYAELAGKLIMQAQEPDGELDFNSCQNMQDIGEKLLRTVGLEQPTKRQVAAVIKAHDQFVAKLERIAGVAKDDAANGKSEPSDGKVELETAAMHEYLDEAKQ